MEPSPQSAYERARIYAAGRGLSITDKLGRGIHGSVHSTSATTAIKAHTASLSYHREVKCYKRLLAQHVIEVRGCHVPQLIAADEGLLVIEMTVVAPPFVLDFASAYLDSAPEFPPEVIDDWLRDKEELFGPQWLLVQNILAILRHQYGIHMLDVNRGNIMFADDNF